MKFLIVDDDEVSRKLLAKILGPLGRCDMAENGVEAVRAVSRAWRRGEPYDLVTLDIMMPEMDGQEALCEIRKLEYDQGIHGREGTKVLMVTALEDTRHIVAAFRAGCEGYIVKPIDRQAVLDKLVELGLLAREETRPPQ